MRAVIFAAIGFLSLPPGAARAQPFYTAPVRNLDALKMGRTAWADYTGNGFMDAVVTGLVLPVFVGQEEVPVARLQANRGLIATIEDPGEQAFRFDRLQLPQAVWLSDAAWGDYDRDGDLDLVLTGATGTEEPHLPVSVLYRNDGGTFTPVEAGLTPVYSGSVAWGDYDNDGDPDLLLTGAREAEVFVSKIYRNDGGAFTDISAGLPGVAYSAAAWGDYDGDGDLDLVLTGATGADRFISRIYRNEGDGRFTDAGAPLVGLAYGSAAWGDYDSDGDLDLLLTGGQLSPLLVEGCTRLYRNEAGSFHEVQADLAGVLYGSGVWGDYDSDGDLDLVLTGTGNLFDQGMTRLYLNESGDTFRLINNICPRLDPRCESLRDVALGAATFLLLDGDHDLDLHVAGLSRDGSFVSVLYQNDTVNLPRPEVPVAILNVPPEAPLGLQAAVQGSTVTLRWDPAVDARTPSPGLSYNVRAGTTPGGGDVLSPAADPATGRRWMTALGNAGLNTSRMLQNLPPGTYYWSVQALDHSFAGSAFAAEGTFTVEAPPQARR